MQLVYSGSQTKFSQTAIERMIISMASSMEKSNNFERNLFHTCILWLSTWGMALQMSKQIHTQLRDSTYELLNHNV